MTNEERRREALERLRPFVEQARGFSGWEFPGLQVKHLGPEMPWDYEDMVHANADGRRCALDMGTGGGEVLARLRDGLPARVVATEEWAVNAPVAYGRLRPLGVDVVRCRSLQLPFPDRAFDLVLNRHEELDPPEVGRVLQPGGCVVTQQVGRDDWRELRTRFPRMADFGDLRGEYSRGFEAAGLNITTNITHESKVAFATLGDLVFMLTLTPWTIPEFGVERDIDALLALEADLMTEDGLVLTESRYLLVAEKPE
jgi:SAM-dependent methyltransferase